MRPLRDTVLDIDDKIVMHKDLAIVFTRDKGKFYRKFEAQRENGECIGYKAINGNTTAQQQKQNPVSNSTPAMGGQINSNGTTGAEQPSTEASNNQTDGQNSQNNDSILGKRKA